MAFLQLGGEAGAKPTYFEVYAADKLVPTLKAALIYSLAVSPNALAPLDSQQPRWTAVDSSRSDGVVLHPCILIAF